MDKMKKVFFYMVGTIFTVVVLPIMLITLVAGDKVDYVDVAKFQVVAPSYLMMIIAFIIFGFFLILIARDKKMLETAKANTIYNVVLFVFFAIIAVVNIELSREFAFHSGYDMSDVSNAAFKVYEGKELGCCLYYSMNPNNIPITYILLKILKLTDYLPNYPFDIDFIWVQVVCVLFSVAGYFSCLILKRLSKSFPLQMINIALFLWLVGMSGWKMVAYTDSIGIIFCPISLYLYLVYRQSSNKWLKGLLLTLSLVTAFIGGWIKPSLYVLAIAIIGVEIFEFICDVKGKYLFLLVALIVTVLSVAATKQYNNYICAELGLEQNPELASTWHHYFAMGTGERKTGGYDSSFIQLYADYQYSQADRINAEMEIAKGNIISRGVIGNIQFAIKKMVKVFDDGGFSFTTPYLQGQWNESQYENVARDTKLTEFLREIYWNGKYMGAYDTITQIVWFVCLFGIPGIGIICFKKKEWTYFILPVSFLGIYFYQLFFEARSRYLFVFLPFIIPSAVYGMYLYVESIRSGKSVGEKENEKDNK